MQFYLLKIPNHCVFVFVFLSPDSGTVVTLKKNVSQRVSLQIPHRKITLIAELMTCYHSGKPERKTPLTWDGSIHLSMQLNIHKQFHTSVNLCLKFYTVLALWNMFSNPSKAYSNNILGYAR